MVRADEEDFASLEIGEFYVAVGSNQRLRIATRTDLLEQRNACYPSSWQKQIQQQMRYYRRVADDETGDAVPVAPPAEGEADRDHDAGRPRSKRITANGNLTL